MSRQMEVVAAKGCDAMADVSRTLGQRVLSVSVIAVRKVVQMTDDGWDAVLTSTGGKGTFLVRRRKGRLSNQCPLLCYEVRRVDTGSSHGRYDRPEHGHAFGGQSGGGTFERHPNTAAVSAAAHHPQRDFTP